MVHGVQGILVPLLADKIPHRAVFAFAERLIEGDGLPRHLPDAMGLLDGEARHLGHLFDVRLAAVLLDEQPRGIAELCHRIDHVHGHPDRAALVGDRAGDRLPDPPGRIGGKLEAAGVFELVDGPHQPGIPLLDQVQERKPAMTVALGYGNHQPQVAGSEVALRFVIPLLQVIESGQPPRQRAPALPRGEQQPPVFHLERLPAGDSAGWVVELSANIIQPAADRPQLLQERRDPLDPQMHFLDQPHRLVPLPHEPLPGGPASLQGHAP